MRIVKKYSNRRLYDTDESRYITLDELAQLVRGGSDVFVQDAKSGEDLTQVTLAHVILESRGGGRLLPVPLLVQMIRMGDDALAEFAQVARPYIQPAIHGFQSLGKAIGDAFGGDFSNLATGAGGAAAGAARLQHGRLREELPGLAEGRGRRQKDRPGSAGDAEHEGDVQRGAEGRDPVAEGEVGRDAAAGRRRRVRARHGNRGGREVRVTPSDMISVALALAVGNFVYQMLRADPNWAQAVERSLFQFVAMFALWAWKELTR